MTSENLGSDQAKNTSTDTLNFIASLEVPFKRWFCTDLSHRAIITWLRMSTIRQSYPTLQSILYTHISQVPRTGEYLINVAY